MKDEVALERLSALAHATRLDVVRLLARHADGLLASEIGVSLGVQKSLLSSHLKIIAAAGLIVGTRSGRFVNYRLDRKRIAELGAFITGI